MNEATRQIIDLFNELEPAEQAVVVQHLARTKGVLFKGINIGAAPNLGDRFGVNIGDAPTRRDIHSGVNIGAAPNVPQNVKRCPTCGR